MRRRIGLVGRARARGKTQVPKGSLEEEQSLRGEAERGREGNLNLARLRLLMKLALGSLMGTLGHPPPLPLLGLNTMTGIDDPSRTQSAKNGTTSHINNRAVGDTTRRRITACALGLVDQTTRGTGIGSTSGTIMTTIGGIQVGGETLLRDGEVVTRIETAIENEKGIGIETTIARLTSPALVTVARTGTGLRPQTRTRTQGRR